MPVRCWNSMKSRRQVKRKTSNKRRTHTQLNANDFGGLGTSEKPLSAPRRLPDIFRGMWDINASLTCIHCLLVGLFNSSKPLGILRFLSLEMWESLDRYVHDGVILKLRKLLACLPSSKQWHWQVFICMSSLMSWSRSRSQTCSSVAAGLS